MVLTVTQTRRLRVSFSLKIKMIDRNRNNLKKKRVAKRVELLSGNLDDRARAFIITYLLASAGFFWQTFSEALEKFPSINQNWHELLRARRNSNVFTSSPLALLHDMPCSLATPLMKIEMTSGSVRPTKLRVHLLSDLSAACMVYVKTVPI